MLQVLDWLPEVVVEDGERLPQSILSQRVKIRIGINFGALPAALSRSDGVGEFGEGRRESMLRVDVPAEFVVAAAKVLTNACPVLITHAERSRFRPHIGCSGPSGAHDRP